jgi:2-keto-4-pentenoate hydratase
VGQAFRCCETSLRSPGNVNRRSEDPTAFLSEIKPCKDAASGSIIPARRGYNASHIMQTISMDQGNDNATAKAIAAEAFAALRDTRQVPPFSGRANGLSVEDAYRIMPLVRRMYEAEGARPVGRKIGFTNRTIWAQYGVSAPIWGYVFDRSVRDLAAVEALPLASFSEPRIEPEIMFGLGASPSPDMDESALSECIAWVALGFEIVQSIFPGWKFEASDTIAANGVHGALLIGPRHPFAPRRLEWLQELGAFPIELSCDGRLIDRGHGENVLGGPLSALRYLVGLLSADSVNPPLAAGEILSTGTLTKAMPIAPGETWTAAPSGIALDPIRLRLI